MLHLRGTSEPWETSPTSVFVSTGSNTRVHSSAWSGSSISIPHLTKHQSLGSSPVTYKCNNMDFHSSGEVNSPEIFLSGRELSPVRWCDREVDGVYLGRSGWVQVQQRSLDDNRRYSYSTNLSHEISKRTGIKLADYHCNSEPGKYFDSTRSLDLNQKKIDNHQKIVGRQSKKRADHQNERPDFLPIHPRDYERNTKSPSPRHISVPESYSPPSVTPIISPPPAFQDKVCKITKTRTFFGKTPFLPRSDAIVDSDASPPLSPQVIKKHSPSSLTSTPQRKKATSPSEIKSRPITRIPQTKSLEDTTSNKRTQFLKKQGESSSSSSSSMGFRSLDSFVTRSAMPRLSENTDSSIDVYEDADDEDNNSSSINLSIVQVNTSSEPVCTRSKEKFSPTNRTPRLGYNRNPSRRSPACSDSNKQITCNSPSSSSSSCNDLPTKSPQGTARRSMTRPYQQTKTVQEDLSVQKVKRSRSLQLPDKRTNSGDRDATPMQTRLSPQHQEPHRLVVKIGATQERAKRHVVQTKPQSVDGNLDEDVLREAEAVTGFLYGKTFNLLLISKVTPYSTFFYTI